MRIFFVLIVALVILGFGANIASAQYPHVKAYFVNPDKPGDPYFWQETKCGFPGQLDTLVVVARNFGWITGVEYCIQYPGCLSWLADFGVPQTTIGFTPCNHPSGAGGISTVFQIPLNSSPVVPLAIPLPVINKVLFMWGSCPSDTPIIVSPHQISGFVRATQFNTNLFVYGIGSTSIICPQTIPNEDTSWGQIKAIFNE
jgi:hypothetical protein